MRVWNIVLKNLKLYFPLSSQKNSQQKNKKISNNNKQQQTTPLSTKLFKSYYKIDSWLIGF